jgi:hypothetical protein
MAISDNPQGNIRPFPSMDAEDDRQAALQNECVTIQTILKLMRFIVQGEEHVADRAWLMDELKQEIANISSELTTAIVVKNQERDPGGRFAFAHDPDFTVRHGLNTIEDTIEVIDGVIEEDRHNDLRAALLSHLHEEFSRVDDILEHTALRPRQQQPTTH